MLSKTHKWIHQLSFPDLKTDLTNTINLKDIKSGENRRKGGRMKTLIAGPKEALRQ